MFKSFLVDQTTVTTEDVWKYRSNYIFIPKELISSIRTQTAIFPNKEKSFYFPLSAKYCLQYKLGYRLKIIIINH